MTPEERGLKLITTYRYDLENSGLDELVFDGNRVNLFLDKEKLKINQLKLTVEEFIWNFQTSENEYKKLICPVYLVNGKFKDISGGIVGVIRPKLLSINDRPDIITNLLPEFHFYFYSDRFHEYKLGKKNKIGVSKEMKDGSLFCKITDWENIQREKIGSNFYVGTKCGLKDVYFERSRR